MHLRAEQTAQQHLHHLSGAVRAQGEGLTVGRVGLLSVSLQLHGSVPSLWSALRTHTHGPPVLPTMIKSLLGSVRAGREMQGAGLELPSRVREQGHWTAIDQLRQQPQTPPWVLSPTGCWALPGCCTLRGCWALPGRPAVAPTGLPSHSLSTPHSPRE